MTHPLLARRKARFSRRPLTVELLEKRNLLAPVSWDGGAGTLDWNDAANWSTDSLPGAADDVTIDVPASVATIDFTGGSSSIKSLTCNENLAISAGTLNIAEASTTHQLSLSGGILGGVGTVTITGSLNWTGGLMQGTGTTRLAVGATGTLSGPSNKDLARTLENFGTLTYNGSGFRFGKQVFAFDPGILLNRAGASFTATGDGDFTTVPLSTAAHAIVNEGTFTRTGAGDTRVTRPGNEETIPTFTNTGTLIVAQGLLGLHGGLTDFTGTTLGGGNYFLTGTLQFPGANVVTNSSGHLRLDGPTSALLNSDSSANGLANFAVNTTNFTLDGRDITTPAFTNSGVVAVRLGSTFTITGGNYTQTAGQTQVFTGSVLDPSGIVDLQAGTLEGLGTLQADVTNAGTVKPGDISDLVPQGVLTIVGNYTQTAAGTLAIEITGTAASQFDQLDVTGSATLDGTLAVTRPNGFLPAPGDEFRVLEFASRAGDFAAYTGLDITADLELQPVFGADNLTLTTIFLNDPPVLDPIGNQAVNEGDLLTFTATATDPDLPAQPLMFLLAGAPAGAAIDATTGVLTWTPTEAQGPGAFTFDVVVSDGTLSDSETITVTVGEVNVAPVLGAIGNQTVNEQSNLSFTATATDGDLPAQFLTFSLVGAPAGATIDPNTGVFNWAPTETQGPGTYTFDVVVSDGSLADSETTTVTVNEANQAPVLDAIGNQTVNELTQLTFTATATDADVPANTLTFSLVGAPAGATIDSNTGVFTWTPTETQGPSTFTFDVTVSDGSLTDSETITVTVGEVNVAPELGAIGNLTVNEQTLMTFTATATDADLPANTLTFSLTGAPVGATIDATTGAFAWTPTEAQGPGTFTFDVVVSDGTLTDSETITVTVNEANVAPELGAIGNQTVNELTLLTFTATATDADLPANTLTFSLAGAPAGAAIDATTGAFAWTPTEAQGPGAFTFDVLVSDGLLTDSETITVTVNEVNVAPELGAIGDRTTDEQTLLTFTATATDADLPANTLTFSLAGAPAGAAIDANTGVFTWTPTEAQGPGTYTFDVAVSDGSLSDSETITVTVNEANVAPVLATIGNQAVNELALLSFTATATDDDFPAQALTFSLAGAPAGATIDATTGVFTWTPTEAQGPGTFTFDVVVSDGTLTDSETITVTVNEANVAPELGAIGNQSVNEQTLLTFTATATDADLPANALTFSLVGAPAGAAIDPTTGVFAWTPTEAQGPGTFTFDVVVSDGTLTDSETITVTVNEINVAPELGAIGNRSVIELTLLTFTATATDADLPAQVVSFSLAGAPAGAAIDATTGVFTWTPTEGQGPGAYTFDVVVSDGSLTDSKTITVTVTEGNAAPVLDPVGNQSVNELTLLTFTATATDADVPAQTLTFSLAGAPAGATIDATTGVFTWTPTEAQGPGTYTFDVAVSDGLLTDNETITVTVTEVNVAPELGAIGNQSVNELAPLTFTATATDADLPANTLTFSLVGAPAGATIDAGTGVFTWTPTEAQGPGTFTFDVVVSDGTLTDTETITVTVNEVNVAPELGAIGNQSANELTLLTFTATATDADFPANTLTYSLVGAPAGATIDATTGEFTWTPTEAQGPGVFTFDVVVSDGTLSDSETITVTVGEVNVAPDLGAIGNQTVNELTLLTFTATATDADLPANTLTFSLAGAPAGATIDAATGVFTWTPAEAHGPGTFTFDVVVSDGTLTDSETITVTVIEVNQAPVLAFIGNRTITANNLLTFTATATDPDLPAQTLTFSLVGAPAGATIDSTTGVFTWTPTPGQVGSHAFTVRVTDDGSPNLFDEETITVTVNPASGVPVFELVPDPIDPTKTALRITGTEGDDVILAIPPPLPGGLITLHLNGTILTAPMPSGHFIVYGLGGNDILWVMQTMSAPGILHGGTGNDVLWAANANDILFGEEGNDTLYGGAGDDILVGGAGDDVLFGQAGNDILVGSFGGDALFGDQGDDLLVAGATAFDGNLLALHAIRNEWRSPGSYEGRVAHLRGTTPGGLNGGNFLIASGPGATVFNDGVTDVLQGGGGRDWFFGDVIDLLTDRGGNEFFDQP